MLAVSSFFRDKEHNTREAMKANMDSENGNRSGLFVVPKLHPGDCLPEKTLGTFVLAARPKRKIGAERKLGRAAICNTDKK